MEEQGNSNWMIIGMSLGVVAFVLVLLAACGILLASIVSVGSGDSTSDHSDTIITDVTAEEESVDDEEDHSTPEATVEAEVTAEVTEEPTEVESTPEVAEDETTPEATAEVEETTEAEAEETAVPTPGEAENSV